MGNLDSGDGSEPRWPGYLGRHYEEGRVLCLAHVARSANGDREARGYVLRRTNREIADACRAWREAGRRPSTDDELLETIRREGLVSAIRPSRAELRAPRSRRWRAGSELGKPTIHGRSSSPGKDEQVRTPRANPNMTGHQTSLNRCESQGHDRQVISSTSGTHRSGAEMATYLHGQVWDVPPRTLTRVEAADTCYWSMWQRRRKPYGVLARGDRILIVDTHRHTRTVAWEYDVLEVAHEEYRSLEEAARIIRRTVCETSGLTEREVREHPYTTAAPPSGYLVGWRGRPLHAWYLPLPPGVRLARHGYTTISDDQLKQLGFVPRPPSSGTRRRTPRVSVTQGQETDPRLRSEIEQHAIKYATAEFTAAGWKVRDRGDEKLGYDLVLSRPGRARRFVEVKGSTGGERAVRVTPAEVEFARAHPGAALLYVLHGIAAEQAPDGQLRCSGGTPHIEDPWEPTDERLKVLTLRYALRRP